MLCIFSCSNYEICELESLFQLVAGFLIDPMVAGSISYIQALFDIILAKLLELEKYSIQKLPIREAMKNVYLLINNSKVSKDFCHLTQIALKLPHGSQKPSQITHHVRFHYSYNLLKDFLSEHVSIESLEDTKNSDVIVPAEVAEFVKKIHEYVILSKDNIDYSLLYYCIVLLDLALDKKMLSFTNNRKACSALEANLVELNLIIPEGGGILIARSRVCTILFFISTFFLIFFIIRLKNIFLDFLITL